MDEQDEQSLDKRVGRLEDDIDEIRLALWNLNQKLDQLQSGSQKQSVPGPEQQTPTGQFISDGATRPPAPEQTPQPPQPPDSGIQAPRKDRPAFSLQNLMNKIGIVLVLLGVVFLFKYSVDQGWITPPLRVAFGMALGSVLLAMGLMLHGKQRHFSQVLMGGGIAALYVSGFAAFSFYELISYTVAAIFMGSVTLLAFILAIQQDEEVLSLVGVIGGLSSPFLLHEGISSATDVVVFSCMVLAGAVAIYMYKGWRLLLWLSVAGGWLTILFLYYDGAVSYKGHTAADKKGLQAGVVFCWIAFWMLPLLREWLWSRNPERWPLPAVISDKTIFEDIEEAANRHMHLLSVSTPLLALAFSRGIWHLTNHETGWLTLGAAVIYGLAFLLIINNEKLRQLAYTQLMVDILLVTLALGMLLDGDVRFLTLTAEVFALHLIAWRLEDRAVLIYAHVLSGFMLLWLAEQLIVDKVQGTEVFNAHALSELAFIIVALVVSFLISRLEVRYIYQICAYVGLLGWLLRELSHLPTGQGYVTVAWGLCAIGLLAVGFFFNATSLRMVALATLLLVVAKLLLVDLSMVKAIWRVLLFIGFGSLFLVLSYYFQSLWKTGGKPPGDGTSGTTGDTPGVSGV